MAQAAGCQVYYWWPISSVGSNEKWLSQLRSVHRRLGRPATVWIAHDTHWKEDMRTLPVMVEKHKGTVERIFFDEGGSVVAANNEEPSYKQPFYQRPGRWGVFHLVSFELAGGRAKAGRGEGYKHGRLEWRKAARLEGRKAGRVKGRLDSHRHRRSTATD